MLFIPTTNSKMSVNEEISDKKYVVACKSYVSGRESYCRNENSIIIFNTKEEAEKYAEKRRLSTSINYHYWVEEY